MLLGELAGLGNAVIWAGLSIVLGRLSTRLTAVRVNAFQLCFAALFYILLVPFSGGRTLFAGLTPIRVAGLLATAILTMGVGDSLYFTSIRRMGASRASPISVSVFPVITILLGAALLGEHLSLPIAGGSALIIGGIVLLVSGAPPKSTPVSGSGDDARDAVQATAGHTPPQPLIGGLLLVLGAAVCWAAATLGLRVAAVGLPAIAVTTIRVPTAALFLLGVLRSRGRLTTDRISRRDWITLLLAGVIGTGLGSFTYIVAIQRTGAGMTALLTSTSPLWVLPLAAVFLHERLTRRVVFGAALALGGIWLVVV